MGVTHPNILKSSVSNGGLAHNFRQPCCHGYLKVTRHVSHVNTKIGSVFQEFLQQIPMASKPVISFLEEVGFDRVLFR